VAFFRSVNERTRAHRGFDYLHHEIMRALSHEDGEAAAKAMAEHIRMAKEQTLRDFEQSRSQEDGQNITHRAVRRRKG
jgi:DNA-binding GntR family transcriptional regulator